MCHIISFSYFFLSDYITNPIARVTESSDLEFEVQRQDGPCPGEPRRNENAYRRTPGSLGINTPFLQLDPTLNFQPPYCLAFTTTLPSTELGTILAVMSPVPDSPSVISLQASSNEIVFQVFGEEARFTPPGGAASFVQAGDYVHLQICVNTIQAELYINCESQPLIRPLQAPAQELDANNIIVFFQNTTLFGEVGDFFVVRTQI